MENSSEPIQAVISDRNGLDSNRWRWTNEVIPNWIISGWSGIYRLNLAKLEKLKICGYAGRVVELLDGFDEHNVLTNLEIGTMNLDSGSRLRYRFPKLQTLSIDRIQIVAQIAGKKQTFVLFDGSPQKVFFGSNSMRHVKLSNYQSVTHLSVEDSYFQRLSDSCFRDLQFLEYTMCPPQDPLEEPRLDPVPFLFMFSEARKNFCFHFNLSRIDSTAFRPQHDPLLFLSIIFNFLKSSMHQIQGTVEGYLNYNKIDFLLPFSSQHFDQSLIEAYEKSTLTRCPWLTLVHYTDINEMLRQKRGPVALQETLRTFAHTFPCVQIVYLVLEPDYQGAVDDLFYTFLNSCRAIRELKVVNSRFEERFFDKLAKLPSLQISLTKLVHSELIDFSWPSFRFLEHLASLSSFTTDSASHATMIYLINRMLVNAEYIFKIRHPNNPHHHYECIVRKTSSQYHLTIDRLNKAMLGKPLVSSFVTLDALLSCIRKIKELENLSQAAGLIAAKRPYDKKLMV